MYIICWGFFFLSFFAPLFPKDAPSQAASFSKNFGYLLQKKWKKEGLPIDLPSFFEGMKEASQEESTTEDLSKLEKLYQDLYLLQGEKNKQETEAFFLENAKDPEVYIVEPGKLHYKILRPGKGEELCIYHHPMVLYTGKYLDGAVFCASTEEEKIFLPETMVGFQKGVLGMKEGEKRLLYIHPEWGYPPTSRERAQALLLFEVELIHVQGEALTIPSEEWAKGKIR